MKERVKEEMEICFLAINDEIENSFAVEIKFINFKSFHSFTFLSCINTGLAWMTYIAYTTKTETHSLTI